MTMNILAFELANFSCSIALSINDDIIEFVKYDNFRGHESTLIPEIKRILQKYGASLPKINVIAITNGPGSFTGIRIALATATGIQISSAAQIMCIPSAQLTTFQYLLDNSAYNKKLLVVLESKRLELYTQLFDCNGNAIATQLLMTPDAIYNKYKNEHLVCIGNGAKHLKEYNLDINCNVPNANDIIRFTQGNITNIDLYPCKPLYAREPDVTIKNA